MSEKISNIDALRKSNAETRLIIQNYDDDMRKAYFRNHYHNKITTSDLNRVDKVINKKSSLLHLINTIGFADLIDAYICDAKDKLDISKAKIAENKIKRRARCSVAVRCDCCNKNWATKSKNKYYICHCMCHNCGDNLRDCQYTCTEII